MSTVGAPVGSGSPWPVWNGNELIIWAGGSPACSPLGLCAGGARYNASADHWTPISSAGVPAARDQQAAASMNPQMLIWGGRGCGSYSTSCADGALYDPQGDTWSPFSSSGAPSARGWVVGAWTGRELFVWGGMDPGALQVVGTGGLYDPVARTWRTVTTTGAPAARHMHSIIWTGSELIVWGGQGDARAGTAAVDGAAYDPASDRWRALPVQGAPVPRWAHTAVWTGTEMIVWGGVGCGVDHSGGAAVCGGGARYVPGSNRWVPVTSIGEPSAREGHSAVWTGHQMIIWGGDGSQCSGACPDGAAYDPATDRWRPLQLSGLAKPRTGHVAAWTGSAMIAWGGFGGNRAEVPLFDGVVFTPTAL